MNPADLNARLARDVDPPTPEELDRARTTVHRRRDARRRRALAASGAVAVVVALAGTVALIATQPGHSQRLATSAPISSAPPTPQISSTSCGGTPTDGQTIGIDLALPDNFADTLNADDLRDRYLDVTITNNTGRAITGYTSAFVSIVVFDDQGTIISKGLVDTAAGTLPVPPGQQLNTTGLLNPTLCDGQEMTPGKTYQIAPILQFVYDDEGHAPEGTKITDPKVLRGDIVTITIR